MDDEEGWGGLCKPQGKEFGLGNVIRPSPGTAGMAFARDLWLGAFKYTYFTFSSPNDAAPRGGCCCEGLVQHLAFPEWKSPLKFIFHANIVQEGCREKGNFPSASLEIPCLPAGGGHRWLSHARDEPPP